MTSRTPLATIGYELATPASFIEVLRAADVELLADVRAVANSRRPGFSKTKLAAAVGEAGMGYVHLRGLGTPAEGRSAVRSGNPDEMLRIYAEHLQTPAAQDDLAALVEIVQSGKKVCLLCLEADPTHCHRSVVAREVAARTPVRIVELSVPGLDDERS